MATLHDQIAKVNERLSELLAPKKEVEELETKKQRLEAELAAQQKTDAKAAQQDALHAACQQKNSALVAAQEKLREAKPLLTQAAASILAEGRLLHSYYPGEAEALNKIISGVEWAIEQLDSKNFTQY